uniref:Uncharacterized protein n=1 Tax=Aegilops tauschii subsp. strangulata TaxID=200361 RepID=A0A453AV93_AEGTS
MGLRRTKLGALVVRSRPLLPSRVRPGPTGQRPTLPAIRGLEMQAMMTEDRGGRHEKNAVAAAGGRPVVQAVAAEERSGRPAACHWAGWLLPFGGANDSVVPPLCTRDHSVPAFLFSSGGFAGNLYHDYTDVLVPLFTSTHHFGGEVQFLLTDIKDWWLDKFTPLFRHLSNYDVIDVDNDQEVHCFSRIVIGSTFHRPMGIDGTHSPGGKTVADFKRLLQRAFLLDRVVAFHDGAASLGKPRLLIISRKSFLCQASPRHAHGACGAAPAMGFELARRPPRALRAPLHCLLRV